MVQKMLSLSLSLLCSNLIFFNKKSISFIKKLYFSFHGAYVHVACMCLFFIKNLLFHIIKCNVKKFYHNIYILLLFVSYIIYVMFYYKHNTMYAV